MDPYGSLYLNEGMYQTALRFLEDCIAENGAEIPLADVYVPVNRETMLIKAAPGWYFTCDSTNTGVSVSKSSTYATQNVPTINAKL